MSIASKEDELICLKKTNTALQELTYLKNIIALVPGNVFWTDLHGNYLGCNNAVARLLNLSSCDEIIGKKNIDLLDPKFIEAIEKTNAEVIATKREILIEESGLNIEGQPAVYLTRKTPLYDLEGNLTGILGVSLDITERKKMEKSLIVAKEKAEAALVAKKKSRSYCTRKI